MRFSKKDRNEIYKLLLDILINGPDNWDISFCGSISNISGLVYYKIMHSGEVLSEFPELKLFTPFDKETFWFHDVGMNHNEIKEARIMITEFCILLSKNRKIK